ncbi:MAG: ABC transporter ATP-binding protein [Myxococcaceae bacterium]
MKRYKALTALHDLSLDIQKGEIFALLGPNGAGKTTLIGAVCGLVKKTSGSVKVFGTELEADSVRLRADIGLVPQEINFDPFFTVREALELQLGYYGKRKDSARVDEVLAALNLTSKAESATRALSGGMKRRLLIAKALVHKPKLLFLDEPTAGVDVELRRDLWTYVRKLRAEGTTIVLTTHYLEEAEELADRVGIINEGKLLLVEEKNALMLRLGEKRLHVYFASPVGPLPADIESGAVFGPGRNELTYTERTGRPSAGDVLKALYSAQLPVSEVETRRSRLEDVLLMVLHAAAGTPAAPTEQAHM